MKKCLMISLISIMALSFVFAQGEEEASGGASRPAFISIGTASAAGAYYPIGVALADVWNKTLPYSLQFPGDWRKCCKSEHDRKW